MMQDIGQVSAVGSPETAKQSIESILQRTGADELMFVSAIWGHDKRLESYTQGASIMAQLNAKAAAAPARPSLSIDQRIPA
jgi:hypothetical protein